MVCSTINAQLKKGKNDDRFYFYWTKFEAIQNPKGSYFAVNSYFFSRLTANDAFNMTVTFKQSTACDDIWLHFVFLTANLQRTRLGHFLVKVRPVIRGAMAFSKADGVYPFTLTQVAKSFRHYFGPMMIHVTIL